MEKLKIGVVGLGGRGRGVMEQVLLNMEDVEIAAVCDVYEDSIQLAADIVK